MKYRIFKVNMKMIGKFKFAVVICGTKTAPKLTKKGFPTQSKDNLANVATTKKNLVYP